MTKRNTTQNSPATAVTRKKQMIQQQRKFLLENDVLAENRTYVLTHLKDADKKKTIPTYISLVKTNKQADGFDQLFVDFVPIPTTAWSYDAKDKKLIWKDEQGGGHLDFLHAGYGGGFGAINPGMFEISVCASVTANFTCAVAENTGATCIVNGEQVTGFNWDANSKNWTDASWDNQRLLLSYTYTPGTPWQPGSVNFSYTDNKTQLQNLPWSPTSNFEASLNLGQLNNGLLGWVLNFKSSIQPPTDTGASNPDSVFPCWLQANEDMAAQVITGVMTIDNLDPLKGKLVSIQGVQSSPSIMGYYQNHGAKAAFGIFMGKMVINGKMITSSYVDGNVLHWTNLDTSLQQQIGLSSSGKVTFASDGEVSLDNDTGNIRLQRLSTSACLLSISQADIHPETGLRLSQIQQKLTDVALNIQGLLTMSPYIQQEGQWIDEIQQNVTNDLQTIMNASIPSSIWNLLFPGTNQPTLSTELQEVANSPVPGVTDPLSWYQSLGTAVMTSGMSSGTDPNCKNMNGPRASQWLKTQVANSRVYHVHSQLLFAYEWLQKFPTITQYLSDQQQNTSGATYQNNINTIVAAQLSDLQNDVQPDPTDPGMVKKLEDIVLDLKNYTNQNNLYWALCYYLYNTAGSILANIAIQMSMSTGSSDPTALSRMFQQNISILTALDPSGYFSKKYLETINVFMATNILPTMFGFHGDAMDPDMIQIYLQKFVDNNINSEDQTIKAAAQQIQDILAQKDADQLFKGITKILISTSSAIDDALSFPLVAQNFLTAFKEAYPKLSGAAGVICPLVIGGITALNCMMLIKGFSGWKSLNEEEKAELVIDASQLGLQLIAAVLKRGVRIYSLFDPVAGLTPLQRLAGVGEIMLKGDSELTEGLARISNATARWIGSANKTAITIFEDSEMESVLMVETAEVSTEEVSMVVRVFGKNLDEFIGTRITPLFILASIGFSIYSIVDGDNSLEKAGDIINIVSGSLMLVSIGLAANGFAALATVAGGFAIVAALAGIAIAIYEMFQTPPDPVQEFVDQYVKQAGFYVSGENSSIDYFTAYPDPNQKNLMMLGFTLGSGGKILKANNDGSITLETTNVGLPETTWQVLTDGLGISKIFTIIQPDATKPPVVAYLSLLSDFSISFQQAGNSKSTPSILSQRWLSIPQSNANLAKGTSYLSSIALALQPCIADNQGNYLPANAKGFLIQNANGINYSETGPATSLLLQMSGIAPNYMSMKNIEFVADTTPDKTEAFNAVFGTPFISTPCTFSISPNLPPFLQFSSDTGTIQPTGQEIPSSPNVFQQILEVGNTLGKGNTNFSITISAN